MRDPGEPRSPDELPGDLPDEMPMPNPDENPGQRPPAMLSLLQYRWSEHAMNKACSSHHFF
jgi:hypothetical protein